MHAGYETFQISFQKIIEPSIPERALLDSRGPSAHCEFYAALDKLSKPLQSQAQELPGVS